MRKKKTILIILIVIILIAIIMMLIPMFHSVRSGSPDFMPKSTDEAIELEPQYSCPMDCEPGKTYSRNGICDVCEMPLRIVQTKDVFDNVLKEENSIQEHKEKPSSSSQK
ncbi:heavy metal-binding domain-containing protein [Seonamhaeicola aphaedonensis]|uniref:Heavy metal binding domain-containing protein n=1 Tax=Seonamhaeicola aphaedonensis TaxID=1461338 RepID=A0A3D9HDJ5_9FLAO|nr:heavy metal-binding domain-containing protein [Seonamhaeicola aphaedonensis]RED47544.1 hypothetical protein DFQ02_106172 [Seonamhaeicola aphaedonensis]